MWIGMTCFTKKCFNLITSSPEAHFVNVMILAQMITTSQASKTTLIWTSLSIKDFLLLVIDLPKCHDLRTQKWLTDQLDCLL